MTARRCRWLVLALAASAAMLALAPALAFGEGTALIMAGSGTPIPPLGYIEAVDGLYIDPAQPFPGQPVFPVVSSQPLFTPEGLYPVTGVNTLPLDTSVDQGLTILNSAVTDGNKFVVLGYSQSATIASLEMTLLAQQGNPVPPSDLSFVLLGDPNNPNGGLFERFAGLTIPSLGLTFSGATPPDTPYETVIYTQEYDGAGDFPQYPINLVSDLNALFGIYYVHGNYAALTPAQVGTAIRLPTDPAYGTDTYYYMIPTQNLPLLDPLRALPVVGNPLADLLQPDLRVIVNLGYGSPDQGWSTGPANAPTPFGVLPANVNPIAVFDDLGAGAQQGVQRAGADLASESLSLSTLQATAEPAAHAVTPVDVVNTLTAAIANDYAVLLPTADIGLTAATTLPVYDASLFATGLADGDPLYALGAPIAADVGVGSLGGLVEFLVVSSAAVDTISALEGLIP